ncbi:MAG: DoxX family protein [Microbacterium sp.]|jgi:uncharacterized membrane protein YphA (DoxX/SURF4 family)|nr:DoxX family protein [Microbacterium sp.]
MLIALWIVNIVLALMMLMAGTMKTLTPKAKIEQKMPWAEDFSAGQIKAIGITEFIGGLGLILPLATGILPILTPIAAVGLVIIMIGAIVVHVRRKEGFTPALVQGVLATASAVLGFLVVL